MDHTMLDAAAILAANYLYLILLLAALVWYLLQPRSAQIDMIAWGLVALPLMYVLLIIAGAVYDDPRPFVVGHFTPLIEHSADNGFPSDHTLLCSATSSIVFFFDKKFSALLWLLTLGVGTARVYTGLHHPLDIMTSVIMAFAISYLAWTFAMPAIRTTTIYQDVAGRFGAR